MAFVFMVAAPLTYLAVIFLVAVPEGASAADGTVLNILLLLAIIQPAVCPFIERNRVAGYKLSQPSPAVMAPSQLLFTLTLIKFAFVEAVYIYGLVVYFLSGDPFPVLYFYAVGIVWSVIYWPRPSTVERFFKKVEFS
jgi:hypothetical protein